MCAKKIWTIFLNSGLLISMFLYPATDIIRLDSGFAGKSYTLRSKTRWDTIKNTSITLALFLAHIKYVFIDLCKKLAATLQPPVRENWHNADRGISPESTKSVGNQDRDSQNPVKNHEIHFEHPRPFFSAHQICLYWSVQKISCNAPTTCPGKFSKR